MEDIQGIFITEESPDLNLNQNVVCIEKKRFLLMTLLTFVKLIEENGYETRQSSLL